MNQTFKSPMCQSQTLIKLASRRAFTLVELLVVISIIGILIALILPSLGASRATTKSLLCLSNQRQIYYVFGQYGNDNKLAVPYWSYFWRTLAAGNYLEHGQTYTGAANGMRYRLFRCPTDEGGTWTSDPAPKPVSMFDHPWSPSSYMMNGTMHWGTGTTNVYGVVIPKSYARFGERSINYGTHWPSLRIKSTSDLVFLMDSWTYVWGWEQPRFTRNIDSATQLDAGSNKARHAFRHPNGTANALYVDGHAAGRKHFIETGVYAFTWLYP